MADPTLYLFDGHNLLHAGDYADQRELTDTLASFVALRGARGFLVWDGVGVDAEVGPLAVRFAPHADAVLERLAAEHRADEIVCLVSSDFAVRGTSGRRCRSDPRGRSSPTCSSRATASRRAPVSATASTTRRVSGSSVFAAATADPNIRS